MSAAHPSLCWTNARLLAALCRVDDNPFMGQMNVSPRVSRLASTIVTILSAAFGALLFAGFRVALTHAEEVAPASPMPTVPPGFSIELVAGPPLVERPIAASFDEEGRLYVTESSGSNDPVAKQLELRPHRIARLEDTDGDGQFDRRTLFADGMMLLQGALFWRGSLYVAAPPSIWKLTDTDGNGAADERVEWYHGQSLTGCANDLHGPYLGPDGWLYWCKGGFGEQTHTIHGREWKTRAAHIFRSRADGSDLEPVLTGGMDNPVGLVFTSDGERILSGTYFDIQPRRDGLLHAIYGGVYGKPHGVLEGHPRTGELMPLLVPMSAAAPCGIERYDSNVFGADFRDNVFLCQFNLRKVSRHELRPAGSSFESTDSDFVVSDHVDFHPTDVLMDADGSLLVIDTGGWYKLCCPTSTLWKPDVLGGIYRVRRIGATPPADSRGQQYDWPGLSVEQLWALLADDRPAVRQRALDHFAQRRATIEVKAFLQALRNSATPDSRRLTSISASALVQLDTPEARVLLRQLVSDSDHSVRQVALSGISLQRDAGALPQLFEILTEDPPANRRIAAEALGRIGHPAAIPHLLAAAASAEDRILQHSITYALIEIADPAATRAGLTSDSPGTRCSALIALDQMRGGGIDAQQVIPLLSAPNDRLRQTACWLVAQHPEWGGQLAEWFRTKLAALPEQSPAMETSELEDMLLPFVADAAIQQLLADVILDRDSAIAPRALALRIVARAKLRQTPDALRRAVAKALAESDLLEPAIAAALEIPTTAAPNDELNNALLEVADEGQMPADVRIAALSIVASTLPQISDPHFELLLSGLATEDSVALRSIAAEGMSKAPLSAPQLQRLTVAIQTASPLELNQLLAPFKQASEEQLGLNLLVALKDSPALPSLRIDLLRETLSGYGPRVQETIDELESRVNVDAASQRKRLEELLPLVASGDVRRGHAVFHSSKAACSACHRLGHAGGIVGPDLTRIGESRTERDLLESILFPSLSFVRGYEPVLIITTDGRAFNGTVRDETTTEYVLDTGPDEQVRVPRDEVDLIQPGTISVMPAGLDQQLTLEQLADLIAFLKNATDHRAAQ